MSEQAVPLHDEIDPKYTWNAPSVFASAAAWQEALQDLESRLGDLDRLRGQLGSGPEMLAQAIELMEDLWRRAGQILVYASMSHSVDMTDQKATRMSSQAQGLAARLAAATAFIDPELLQIGRPRLQEWMAREPRLARLEHYVDDLFRQQEHVRSAEVEEVLGMAADPFSGASATASVLINADFQFKPATGSDGQEIALTEGTLAKILSSPDRTARRTAWEHYTDEYLAHKNTLANSLATSIKQNVFLQRVRRYSSTLEASLSGQNIPVDVFHNLVTTFRKNLPTWHRYWALRRRLLGVETLQPYDIWAPLSKGKRTIPYEQAVEWICEGLAPMGGTYVETVRRGCLVDRWIDVYPNRGKRSGAFSTGRPGTWPFIMTSYNDNVFSLSTLAHELGHSMHSYLTWQNQPVIYSHYSLFVAEVASNFHQAMVRAHLLDKFDDPVLQIELIEEAMSNFHRYFFIMPTLARFELETHRRVEQGQGLTADDMNGLMADLFAEGYGGQMEVDRDRVGITWATFGHLYIDYYVYQYATGISGAHALLKRVLSGGQAAVEDYQRFLRAGGSLYPLDALKMAGVDLTTPEPVEIAFGVLAGMVDRLEGLVTGGRDG